MSFNFFVTQVPIEQLVTHAHSQSARITAIQKTRAAWKIDNELKRQIKDKKQKERLDKVLNSNKLQQKQRVEDVHNSHQEKMDAVTAFQKKKQKEERKNQLETYKKIEQDAIYRD